MLPAAFILTGLLKKKIFPFYNGSRFQNYRASLYFTKSMQQTAIVQAHSLAYELSCTPPVPAIVIPQSVGL